MVDLEHFTHAKVHRSRHLLPRLSPETPSLSLKLSHFSRPRQQALQTSASTNKSTETRPQRHLRLWLVAMCLFLQPHTSSAHLCLSLHFNRNPHSPFSTRATYQLRQPNGTLLSWWSRRLQSFHRCQSRLQHQTSRSNSPALTGLGSRTASVIGLLR